MRTCLILIGGLLLQHASLRGADTTLPPDVQQVGFIRSSLIKESSGIAPCRSDPKVFWTHNDGKHRTLFAIDRQGRDLGSVQILVGFEDWEDIASNHQGQLYLADTGNNKATRSEISVHEIDEPDPRALPRAIKVNRSWKLHFPKEIFDCESLFIWQGHGYLISKVFNDARAGLYRFPLKNSDGPILLHKVARLHIDSPVTGADLSEEGDRLAIVTKTGAAVIQCGGNLIGVGEAKPIWTKFRHEHIEACCFVPEGLLATAESREIYLFTASEFRPAPKTALK